MPHLDPITRKTWYGRFLLTAIYTLLTLGGVTMIAPFLLWMAASTTSEVDTKTLELVPAYWHRQDMLLRKYCELQANFDIGTYTLVARDDAPDFAHNRLPREAEATEAADYRRWLAELPSTYTVLGGAGLTASTLRLKYGLLPAIESYRAYLLHRYGSVEGINTAYRTTDADITQVIPPGEGWWQRLYQPEFDAKLTEFLEFKQRQPLAQRYPVPAEGVWPNALRTAFGNDLEKVNAALGTSYPSLLTIPMPGRRPAGNPALAAAWERCVRQDMALWFIRLDRTAQTAWQAFLHARYLDDIRLYNAAHDTDYASFMSIAVPAACPHDTAGMGEWNDFLAREAPVDSITLDTPESRYRAFLRKTYSDAGGLAHVNEQYGTHYRSWDEVLPPTARVWAADCRTGAGHIRWSFLTRNYRTAAAYMVTQGRAFVNTIVYVGLAILFTLTVNPLAAYALSRFKLKATNKILLFLLATMAFPAEISMIPNFLLLKELSLLNTFWALVLPGMASGFSIFLLKGMFDALPQDLYEAAELDGAGEGTIFLRITMPLVKPFLAYLALGTFVAAYSAFAFAFILCPDPKMWTMMVYLQQMETWASQPIQFAAFVLASLPTLLVFITCQRVIMRGIILPSER